MSEVHQIRELTLRQLDVVVAICEGYDVQVCESGKIFLNKEGCSTLIVDQDCSSNPKWSPNTCGNLCMQLMQKYQVQTSYYKDLDVIFWYCRTLNAGDTQYGQNANLMVAVCQAIVCFVLDSTEITLPEGV